MTIKESMDALMEALMKAQTDGSAFGCLPLFEIKP
jgi:hypothetical protein